MAKMYMAYGSNLNLAQMAFRCPGSKPYSTAKLKGYRLVYRGAPGNAHATIEPAEGKEVPVLIWKVPQEDERALDRYEGYPKYYYKETLPAILDASGMAVEAMVYIMDKRKLPNYPSPSYVKTIEEGYENCKFDMQYLYDSLIENTNEVENGWRVAQ